MTDQKFTSIGIVIEAIWLGVKDIPAPQVIAGEPEIPEWVVQWFFE